MTTEQLRKEIMVTNWHLSAKGLTIDYWRGDNEQIFWVLPPSKAVQLLSSIGSIDGVEEYGDEIVVSWNDNKSKGTWEDFSVGKYQFKFSQWEALTLAIRHELEKETEKEIDNSDIGKAIGKLK